MTRFGARMIVLVVAASGYAALEKVQQTGPVESAIRLEPESPVIGDEVTLTLRVTGEKDVELIMPEFGQMLERFSIVDFSTNEQIDGQARTVITQRYVLQPTRSGRLSIPPILIEYVDRRPGQKPAPDDMDAYEHLTERLDFEVRSVLPTDAQVDLHPPLGELKLIEPHRSWAWGWVIAGTAVIIACPFIWRLWSAHRRIARQRSAFDIAVSRLDALLGRPRTTASQIDAFFVELSAIVRSYLENRFDLRAPELTTEEFLDLMARSPDLSNDHQELLRGFLSRADLVKFARFMPTEEDIDRSIKAARRFLDETRQKADQSGQKVEVAHA